MKTSAEAAKLTMATEPQSSPGKSAQPRAGFHSGGGEIWKMERLHGLGRRARNGARQTSIILRFTKLVN